MKLSRLTVTDWPARMRNLFLALLLANLLVLAWQRWIAPSAADDPFALADSRSPRLALLARNEDTPPADPGAANDAAACFRVGPFQEPEKSRAAADLLAVEGMQVFRYSESGEIWVGHWVQVIDLQDRAAAETALDRLASAGRRDAYIVRGDDGYRVSLGVFRSLEGAESVSNQALKAGLTTLTTDRYRAGSEYWLLVDNPAGGSPDLAALDLSDQAILRSEAAPCRDFPVGESVPDSLESLPPVPE